MNEPVVEALIAALDNTTGRRAVRERARATGRLVVSEPPAHSPGHDDLATATRPFGDAVSTALAEERSAR